MMAGTHDDAHVVCQLRRKWVIFVETAVPHGGPEVVGFQTEHEFKDAGVCLGIDASKLVVTPRAERRPLVVDEYATVFHFRFTIRIDAALGKELFMFLYGCICHPVPG